MLLQRRIEQQKRKRKSKPLENPLPEGMIEAIVWIKPYILGGSCYPVRILLPQDKIASKIHGMKKNGFWCVDHGQIVWYNPDSVLEIRLINMEELEKQLRREDANNE